MFGSCQFRLIRLIDWVYVVIVIVKIFFAPGTVAIAEESNDGVSPRNYKTHVSVCVPIAVVVLVFGCGIYWICR